MAARTSDKLSKTERRIMSEERRIEKEEKKIERVEKEILLEVGALKIRKRHVFDIAKTAGGALLGTGLGLNLISYYGNIAAKIPYIKAIGFFITAIFISAFLVYHEEHAEIQKAKHKLLFLCKRLASIYFVSIFIVGLVVLFFSPELIPYELVIKILLIGSFSSVAGAVTFDML